MDEDKDRHVSRSGFDCAGRGGEVEDMAAIASLPFAESTTAETRRGEERMESWEDRWAFLAPLVDEEDEECGRMAAAGRGVKMGMEWERWDSEVKEMEEREGVEVVRETTLAEREEEEEEDNEEDEEDEDEDEDEEDEDEEDDDDEEEEAGFGPNKCRPKGSSSTRAMKVG